VTTSYLLPCPCGQKVPVEPRQAGEVVRCSCGASLGVPTMLEMAALERAEPEPAPTRPKRPWGVRQSVALLGVAVFLSAMALVSCLVLTRPTPAKTPDAPTPESIRRKTQAFSAVETLQAWRILRAGGLRQSKAGDDRYQKDLFVWHLWMGVVLTIALVGVALFLTPLLTKRRPAPSRAGSAKSNRRGLQGAEHPDP
jgi:hypothetical protein